MKAKREQMDDDKRLIIKLFANNYARDLLYTMMTYILSEAMPNKIYGTLINALFNYSYQKA